MFKGRLIVLLVFALVLVNIQCVAFCAVESCHDGGTTSTPASGDVPPCHQHHQAPGGKAPSNQDSASCQHRLVQAVSAKAGVTPALAAGDLVASLPVVSPFGFPPAQNVDIFPAGAPWPPGLDPISTVVLRI
jgi:hypothetical protein